MTPIKKVIVLGASGNVGREVVKALIQASFEVTVARRVTSASGPFHTSTAEARVQAIDYDSPSSLEKAFAGQDAIVEAFNPVAAIHQERIIRAAISVGVRHVLTPEFSSNTFNQHVDELKIFEPKRTAQAVLESVSRNSNLHWTAIIVGPFFDWAIAHNLFWVNPHEKVVTVFGSGNQEVSMSSIDIVGRAAVAVLTNPQGFLDRPAYFADHTVTSNTLLALLNGMPPNGEWKANTVALEGWLEVALKKWEEDTRNGVKDRLHSQAYAMLGTYGLFEESDKYGANFSSKVEKGFGVPRERFKEMLSEAVKSSRTW